ncbi:amylo-alpha-1,6-glucosidase [Mesorhizobium sp. B2-3-3]|nr:amylo-alpha-1,6-glucosidase [Mesorhizobium sp. B2-3-3]
MQSVSAEAISHAPFPGGSGVTHLAQLFVPSLQERRPRTLKHDDIFGVFDRNGDVLSGPGSPDGIYYRDTRYLSHLGLTINGARPMLLSSTLRDDNATLTCDLTNPDIFDAEGVRVLKHDLIHLRRTRLLWDARCFERLAVRNFDEVPHRLQLELVFASDFADLFEVRGTPRPQRGQDCQPDVTGKRVSLAYVGLDGVRRTTILSFDPVPATLTGEQATFVIELAPHETRSLFVDVGCDNEEIGDPSPRRTFFIALRDARRALRYSTSKAAAITTSNELFDEAMHRSVADLYMLITQTPEGPYPFAGIPWFSTVFGRDALITAMEMLWLDPSIARGVLLYLAANQATAVDHVSDAEPGKILHEVRHGEMAVLREVPFRRYYGSVDSTPLFIMLAGAYLERTSDLDTLQRLMPNIEAALAWIDDYGDRDKDGFVEYQRLTPDGLANQGWKDSSDSVFHADGTLAKGPIALAEVQAYVYGAWCAAAAISRRLGNSARANKLEARASDLRDRFDVCFFDEQLGTYVLALDGDKRPCRVRSSNAGHTLFTGLARAERAKRIVQSLTERAFFTGWGIRTIAATEARYNPMSYHNGSVWPHDNALIAAGFARYGFRHEAAKIFEGLFAASTYLDLRRLPELFCGFPRQSAQAPTFYPVACNPQAWAAAAPLLFVQACLGLEFDPKSQFVVFDAPVLPRFLDQIVLRRLSLGAASVDVALRRTGSQVVVDVLGRTGSIRVVAKS